MDSNEEKILNINVPHMTLFHVEEVFNGIKESGVYPAEIDTRDTHRFSTAAIQLFLVLHQAAGQLGQSFVLSHHNPELQKEFATLGLDYNDLAKGASHD